MQVVLVAGGAGFIGSWVCERLLKEGYSVVCIDNLITGDQENIAHLSSNSQFTFLQHDITKGLHEISSSLENIDYIIHLASPASPNKNSKRSYINFPIETLQVNSQGTHNLLTLAQEKKARFLFASTSEVYGDPEVSPQPEEYFGNVNPVGTRSVYDEAKRFGEAITMAYVRKYLVNGRIVRIFNTYGPRMQVDDGRVVSNFITQALQNKPLTIYGTGQQTRSFCYIDDMVDGILKAVFSKEAQAEVINIGNPDERTIADLAEIIKEKTQTSSTIVYHELPQDDPKVRCPDIQKAQKLLKWTPTVSIGDGLDKTIAYFQSVL